MTGRAGPTGVRWLSITPGSGYGDSAESYLSGLRAAGVPVTWTPMGWPSPSWGTAFGPVDDADLDGCRHRDLAQVAVDHDTVVVHSVPVWHRRLAREATGRRLVSFTTWETDRLDNDTVAVVNRYDRVLVPSQFNRDVFESSGVTCPVRVVPHIARTVPAGRPGRPADGRFVFYVIATWTTRKAIADAVRAYLEAFSPADDVVLVIHTGPDDLVARAGRPAGPQATWRSLARILAGRGKVPDIELSTRHLDRAGIDGLHARGDCFVSLSRGEGWGLGAFDAAAAANPVVVTRWGGSLDFLPPGYPYGVEFDLIDTVDDPADAWWEPRPGERWARARIDHAAAQLRAVFDHRAEARSWGRALQADVRANFSSEQVTRRLVDALDF